MKLLPTGVGAEPKKVAILGGLVAVLIAVYFMNRTPDSPGASVAASSVPGSSSATGSVTPRAPAPLAATNRGIDSVTPMPPQRAPRNVDSSIQDFKPSLKPPDGVDVSRIDPTLHLDVIAKLRTESLEGGARSIFDFGAPPVPKTLPVVAPIKPGPVKPVPATPAPPPTPPPAPSKPAVPPIPLKFYGYVDASNTSRRAFFMQGDDIFVAGENEMVGSRYRILRITANSAIVEDTATKNQQTLPLVEELPG